MKWIVFGGFTSFYLMQSTIAGGMLLYMEWFILAIIGWDHYSRLVIVNEKTTPKPLIIN